jgi:putative restriction endonuclease
LLSAYARRCAITDCNAEAALEAAHINPYCESSSNRISNGMLLRSDIHTLFDLGLICINPKKMTVEIAKELAGSSYEVLRGKTLRLPENAKFHPDKNLLSIRWKEFASRNNAPPNGK